MSLSIIEKAKGKDELECAAPQSNLGSVYVKTGKL
jgi:hypothetical protein